MSVCVVLHSGMSVLKMSRMQLLKCVTGVTATSQICTKFNAEDALSDFAEYAFGSVRIASGQFVLDVHAVVNFRTITTQTLAMNYAPSLLTWHRKQKRTRANPKPGPRLRRRNRSDKHVRGVILVHPTVLRTVASPKPRHRKIIHHLLTGKMTGGYSFQVLIRS